MTAEWTSTPTNKNQEDFKKKYLLAGISPGSTLELTQLQHWFEEEKTQAFPVLWSHCCSSGTRAQPSTGKCGWQPKPPVSAPYGIEAGKTVQGSLQHQETACWSPDGNLLELGPQEIQDPNLYFISRLHSVWTNPRFQGALACQLHESFTVSGKPCVDQIQPTWKLDNFSYNPEQLRWIALSQAYLLLLNYPVTRLRGDGFFYHVNKWSRQHNIPERLGFFIVFKYLFLWWLALLSADCP